MKDKWIHIKKRLPDNESVVDIYTRQGFRLTDCIFTNYEGEQPEFYYSQKDVFINIEDVDYWRNIIYPKRRFR